MTLRSSHPRRGRAAPVSISAAGAAAQKARDGHGAAGTTAEAAVASVELPSAVARKTLSSEVAGERRPAYLLIRDLPTSERPRERLARYGAGQLSTAELLAIIWRTGTAGAARESALAVAGRALATFGGLEGLAKASPTELCRINGIGPVKAIELSAAIELGRRVVTLQPEEKPVVRSPRDVVNLVHSEMAHLDREHLRVVLLNTKNHVQAVRNVYQGTLNSSAVRVAELFREAIRENCASVIIVHNHPSGDPTPSPEDVRVTAEAVKAGQMLDIEVLDHIIVGDARERYVSLKERGLGFS